MNEKEIVISEEMIKKAKTAGTVEELLAMAKENGYEMTEEEAKTAFSRLNSTGEIADDELEAVAGGKSCINPFNEEQTKVVVDTLVAGLKEKL